MIKLIVAHDKNRLIGNENKMVWNIPAEMEHFRKSTLNKTILMGQTTFIGIGKSLSNRKTIVLTQSKNFHYEGVKVVDNVDLIIKKYKGNPDEDIMICGGEKIYELFISHIEQMIISEVKGNFVGNKYFPKWDKSKFTLTSTQEHKEFSIKIYDRIII